MEMQPVGDGVHPGPAPAQNADTAVYDTPAAYSHLSEVASAGPVGGTAVPVSGDDSANNTDDSNIAYDAPDRFADLNELAGPLPVENPEEGSLYRHITIEERIEQEQEQQRSQRSRVRDRVRDQARRAVRRVSVRRTEVYTVAHLVFFSLWGTLARLGLDALTDYSNAPVTFGVLWSNFAGTAVMGFLAELAPVINRHMSTEADKTESSVPADSSSDGQKESEATPPVESLPPPAPSWKRRPVPLYIGMATGFCGSFTSFSTFILDAFEAMANSLGDPVPRSRGDDVMALLAVLLLTVGLCASALKVGAHMAVAVRWVWSLPALSRHLPPVVDGLAVFLGFGCWLGAVFMAIWPPHDHWRSDALFALVFAPLGTLLRFGLSLRLNGLSAAFPVGTFAANCIGCAILAMSWDLQHAPASTGIAATTVGCQVLQGVMDGFCGCLTTVSTWMTELNGLRRRHAYVYGGASLAAGFSLLVVIVGPLRWTVGWQEPACLG